MKVLIVDDDPVALQILEAVLEGMGHAVLVRDEALGTMSAVVREKPDVVVLDVRMPGLAGDRLATVLGESYPAVAVILHSSMPAAELQRTARACGAAGFIEKVDDPALFARSLERIMNDRHVAVTPARRVLKR
jgi:DNA-binding NtrC family response regulator